VKLKIFKRNLKLDGGRSKSKRGPDLARGPPVGHRWSRQCGNLNISQPYRPPRPVTGIALRFCFIPNVNVNILLKGVQNIYDKNLIIFSIDRKVTREGNPFHEISRWIKVILNVGQILNTEATGSVESLPFKTDSSSESP
jgi:hypothetical protein